MIDSILQGIDEVFKGKTFLTPEEVAQILECSPMVVYNWTRRSNPKKRPPKIMVGKSVRFPKIEFIKWLAQEHSSSEQ